MKPYNRESGDFTRNAQINLEGRTHYVDPGTLRFHKARITASGDTCNGLLFYVIESCALDYQNTRRGFRAAVFDLFGTVIYRPNLESTFRTTEQARTAMYAFINSIDPVATNLEGAERQAAYYAAEIADARTRIEQAAQQVAA